MTQHDPIIMKQTHGQNRQGVTAEGITDSAAVQDELMHCSHPPDVITSSASASSVHLNSPLSLAQWRPCHRPVADRKQNKNWQDSHRFGRTKFRDFSKDFQVLLFCQKTEWYERHSYCQDMPLQCPSLHFLQLLSAVASFYQRRHTKHTLPQLLQTHKIHSTSTAANTHTHKNTTSIAANTPKKQLQCSMTFRALKKGSSKLMKGT